MLDFDDAWDIMQKKPYWVFRMTIYAIMIAVGFGLHVFFKKQAQTYEAMEVIRQLQDPIDPSTGGTYTEDKYRNWLLREFYGNPKIKEVIGTSYSAIEGAELRYSWYSSNQ